MSNTLLPEKKMKRLWCEHSQFIYFFFVFFLSSNLFSLFSSLCSRLLAVWHWLVSPLLLTAAPPPRLHNKLNKKKIKHFSFCFGFLTQIGSITNILHIHFVLSIGIATEYIYTIRIGFVSSTLCFLPIRMQKSTRNENFSNWREKYLSKEKWLLINSFFPSRLVVYTRLSLSSYYTTLWQTSFVQTFSYRY